MNFLIALVSFANKQMVPAILFFIFGALYAFCAWSWRDRIPFAAVMLETVAGVTRKYPGVIVTGFAGLVTGILFLVWVSLAVSNLTWILIERKHYNQ
jgi:hypothetical protein